jgi:hypothetical protein
MTLRGVLQVALGLGIATPLAAPTAALAQEEWKEEEGEKPPPDDRPATPPKTRDKDKDRDADGQGQEGATGTSAPPPKLLLELKIGPAFVVASKLGGSKGATEFGIYLHAGYALGHDLATSGDVFYLTITPNLLVGSDFGVIAPLGAQYDFPLKMIPYEGLYAYARASVGYLYYQPPFVKIDNGVHGFAVQPAIGARMTLAQRFHVGIEPLGFSVLHTFPPKSTTQREDTLVAFQIAILGGARF